MKSVVAAIIGIFISIGLGVGVYNTFISVDPALTTELVEQKNAMALAQEREPKFPEINMADIPKDHENLDEIIYGYNLVNETHVYAEDKVGANLSCTSCHAGAGLQEVASLVGVQADYPKYIARAGDIVTIEKRINGCMVRSMNGKPFEADSKELEAMVAYFDYISEDVELGQKRPWAKSVDMKQVPTPNVQDGEQLYNKSCISCHAADGSGIGANAGPALWGETSFNDGAGIARMSKMAGFIQAYMPVGQEMTLTDQEASDLAAYILTQDRPEWGKHDKDWPKGDKPSDIMTKERREQAQNGTIDWAEVLVDYQ
ncbi:c-type cytochrome [Solibacillus daqui]|uniref:c-type cytochrome n=1 Tax=Solibacillus daqui TaxID=2912187 RepID=UPI0023670632|nr:c-type cytochrome [Solibacillus daqui]